MPGSMKYRYRVHAYITHGERLLVFEHTDFPEAGIQVPAGTVQIGESPEVAVLREAREETGLVGLQLVGELGHFQHDMREFGLEEIQWRDGATMKPTAARGTPSYSSYTGCRCRLGFRSLRH